jgi:hypothetical protein
MNSREFYKLSILSRIMSIGFVDLQLWLKNRAAILISVLLKWVRILVSLSNVALVDCLGVRSLTQEKQLYIRLCRLGKYFSFEEEICTCC